MPRRSLTGYTVGFALIVAVLVAVRRPLASSIQRARAEDSELDRAPSRVGFYRYRARRDTVAAMRAYLLKVVAAESAFVAESGRVRDYVFVETTKGAASTASVHVEWPFAPPFIWWAVLQSVDFRITCWVYVGPDTTMSHSASGQPACASDRAVPPGIIRPFRGSPR